MLQFSGDRIVDVVRLVYNNHTMLKRWIWKRPRRDERSMEVTMESVWTHDQNSRGDVEATSATRVVRNSRVRALIACCKVVNSARAVAVALVPDFESMTTFGGTSSTGEGCL